MLLRDKVKGTTTDQKTLFQMSNSLTVIFLSPPKNIYTDLFHVSHKCLRSLESIFILLFVMAFGSLKSSRGFFLSDWLLQSKTQ